MSQTMGTVLGLLLCIATAVGCIGYEHIVTNFSYRFLLILKVVELGLVAAAVYYLPATMTAGQEIIKFSGDSKSLSWGAIYVISGITVPLWYVLTKQYGVLVSSTFELKYIVVLAVFYIIIGESKVTLTTLLGVGMALLSTYLITKEQ